MNFIKKYLKFAFRYTILFIILLLILFGIFTLVAKIPRECIENNIKQSVNFYKDKQGIEKLKKKRDYTFIHYYADSMLLNIIYCMDSNHPIKSIMWANYFEKVKIDTNRDFIDLVENKKEPNEQYIRYWHGSIIILKPLLTIFNIEQIYSLNIFIMYLLALLLFVFLIRKSKKIAILYIISMIMIYFPIVPYCLEYSWTFYIMFITSIIAISIEKRGNKGLYNLFFISGILTCFLDFLSTEIITIFVPLLLVFAIRKKENRLPNYKKCLVFFAKVSIIWIIAYIAMWLAKWTLASIILNINAIEYVKDNAILRINGLQRIESKKRMYLGALFKNFHNLYPLNNIKNISKLWKYVGIFFAIVLVSFDCKNIKNKSFSLLMLIIGIIPYIRYLVLANHSYKHAFFTFRDQMITIIALGLIIIDCFYYKLWFKQVNIKKQGSKNGKRINNINSSTK